MEEPIRDTNDADQMVDKKASFRKVMGDKLRDMLTTFPELEEGMDANLHTLWKQSDYDEAAISSSTDILLKYCEGIFPARFFDILYENEEIFTNDDLDLHFLPGIDYKELWKTNISDNTRSTIWKYLQLILFSSVSGVGSAEGFGDTAELFKAINEEDFKKKLEETMQGMQDMFKTAAEAQGEEGEEGERINLDDLPDPQGIHEHVQGLMNGKLGALAAEIAEETAADLGMDDMKDANSVNDVFAKLLKDPKKIMGMVKNVGSKLDEKIKSGDIKESELLEEASEMMKKMKDMPGMENIQSMLSKMGLGKQGGKINHSAMQAHMERNIKLAQTKERMRQRAGQKANTQTPQYTPEQLAEMEARAEKARQELLAEFENDRGESVFRSGGGAQRSAVRPSNNSDNSSSKGSNGKGKKKKKNKGKGKKKK
tara:strand:+ start:1608 stop:2888 length:1281 start_codon:yes stop_codon:yes gene_type:complete